ncbi:hypothetical protein PTTG_08914 [Puccinia triticina 1-1 BBBD Race 1]|uniref:NAM-associated domain-containing protein n=1 Tax=Puccinia triticina (isolate 1-1 / race 1 (BBBD)) TaxID=630390 RepID=A0A180GQN2_PUCT1|nr:hypothetical protein PTTG_08914 [Puccinia triticina 1-1 BBBD Race 1]
MVVFTRLNSSTRVKAEISKRKRAASPTSEHPPSNVPESTPAPSDAVSEFDGTGTDASILERPVGKKKAKLLNQIAAKDQEWKADVACAQTKIASESERFNDIISNDSLSLKRITQNGETAAELTIMNKNLDNLDSEQQEYYKLKRKEILQSLRNKTSSRQT